MKNIIMKEVNFHNKMISQRFTISSPPKLQQPSNILTLIIEFYCGLAVRNGMSNISHNIRQFVMSRGDVTNKEKAAKHILDFFLKLESSLVTKSDKNWDQAFQLATARAKALLKICEFPNRNLHITAMTALKSASKITKRDCETIVMGIEADDEVSLEIEKDVKMKTLFFFKWCQFVGQCKTLKLMKQREVENKKISLSFNKYGTKSNYFNAWKILSRKSKLENQKVTAIQKKCSDNLLKKTLSVITQIAAIVTIEQTLAKKIQVKIGDLKKKSVLKKLKRNQVSIKNQTSKHNHRNQYIFMFLNHFLTRMKPLMNRSFQLQRKKFEEQANQDLLRRCFYHHRRLTEEKMTKQRMIIRSRKEKWLKNWQKNRQEKFGLVDRMQKLRNWLRTSWKKGIITTLSFKKWLREQKFKKIQTMVESNGSLITKRNLIQIDTKKQLDRKHKALTIYHKQKQSINFISKIKDAFKMTTVRDEWENKIRKIMIRRLRLRYEVYVNRLSQRKCFLEKMQKKHRKNILYCSFKSWRKLKAVTRMDEASIEVLSKYSKKIMLMNFWAKLKLRAFQKNCIETLVNASQNLIFKLAYLKIQGRSTIINDTVRKIQIKAQKKCTRKLFDLLFRNSRFNAQRSQLIQKQSGKRNQILLMSRLKQLHDLKNLGLKVKLNLLTTKMTNFYKQLASNYNKQQQLNKKCQSISKKVFLAYLLKSCISGNIITKQLNGKSKEVCKFLRQTQSNKFFSKLNQQKKEKQFEENKAHKIMLHIARRRIIEMREFMQLCKGKGEVQRKKNVIICARKQQAFRIFGIKSKSKNLVEIINEGRVFSGLADFCKFATMSVQMGQLEQYLEEKKQSQAPTLFFKFIRSQIQKTGTKLHQIQNLRNKCHKRKGKKFFQLLRSNKENIENKARLISLRKQTLLSSFIATHLKQKFSRMKFNCSLKTYAKNIMKKAFKSLRIVSVKQRQKENVFRFDRSSSILVDKSIEKSIKANSLSQQIQRFNLRKSRQVR